jgi:hypothetical protein
MSSITATEKKIKSYLFPVIDSLLSRNTNCWEEPFAGIMIFSMILENFKPQEEDAQKDINKVFS